MTSGKKEYKLSIIGFLDFNSRGSVVKKKKRQTVSSQHFFCITLPIFILLSIIVIQIFCLGNVSIRNDQ